LGPMKEKKGPHRRKEGVMNPKKGGHFLYGKGAAIV